jgi:hypothetical protein
MIVGVVLATTLGSGCSIKHDIAKDYPQYLQNNQGEYLYGSTDSADGYHLTSSTQKFRYEFRAYTTGYANLWIVDFGQMLDATMQSSDVQEAFNGISKVTNLVERDGATLVFELVNYEFVDYAAKVALRARLQRGKTVIFEKLYQNAGRSQGGKMFWGGAFAQRNAVHQSTKHALDEILGELINDLNAADTSGEVKPQGTSEVECIRSALDIRSGSANLNSAISGNSWYKAGSKVVWQKGVSDGQEESIGAAYPPHPRSGVQGAGGLGRLTGRQDLGRAVRAVRAASQPDHRMEAATA